MRIERDDHHTMHQQKVHEVYPVYQSIRNNPSMIAHGLARTAHNLLHRETSPVPLLNYYTAMRVANRLPSGLYVTDGIDEFSRLVEESNKHPKIKPIEIDQNELVIRALRAQIPYLEEGMPSNRRIIV